MTFREGVCSLCHGGQPLGSAGFGVLDDLPGPVVSGGRHCCASESRHWTQLWVFGAAQAAGAEPQYTEQTALTHDNEYTQENFISPLLGNLCYFNQFLSK